MTEVAPLKRFAAINASVLTEATAPDTLITYADLASVSPTGSVSAREMPFDEAPSRARRLVRSGDTLMPTLVNARSWQSTRPLFVSDALGQIVFSTGFFSASPKLTLAPRFLYYVLSSRPALSYLESRAVGVTMIAFSHEAFGSLPVPAPRLERQHEIAVFLDAETARIDSLIEKKQQMIELLDERVTALIEQSCVGQEESKGWDGRSGWSRIRLRHACASIFLGLTSTVDYVEEGGIPLVRAVNITGGVLDMSSVRYISEHQHQLLTRRNRARRGDVLLSKSGSIGTVAIVETDRPFSIYESIFVLRPAPRILTSRFLAYLLRLRHVQGQFQSRLAGMGVQHLNMSDVVDIVVAIPSTSEQQRIVERLDEEIAECETMRDRLIRQNDLLHERRSALITAAVTGELDLTEAA